MDESSQAQNAEESKQKPPREKRKFRSERERKEAEKREEEAKINWTPLAFMDYNDMYPRFNTAVIAVSDGTKEKFLIVGGSYVDSLRKTHHYRDVNVITILNKGEGESSAVSQQEQPAIEADFKTVALMPVQGATRSNQIYKVSASGLKVAALISDQSNKKHIVEFDFRRNQVTDEPVDDGDGD